MVWSVFLGRFFGDHFFAETLPCSVAFVFFGAGALSCSVALVFGSFIFFPVNLVVVCGTNEGVQKIYKTNVFLHFLKKMRGRKRQQSSKYIRKSILCTLQMGALWRPLALVHFFGRHVGCSNGAPKNVQNSLF